MESSGLVLSVSHPLLVNTYIPFKNKIVRALNTNVRKFYYLKGASGETMSNMQLFLKHHWHPGLLILQPLPSVASQYMDKAHILHRATPSPNCPPPVMLRSTTA